MITTTEAWLQQTRQACLDVCAATGNDGFRQFGEQALKALLVEELRRYTPHSLSACLLDLWRFADEARQDIELRVFNPDMAVNGWRPDGTVVEVSAREMPFLLNTLRIALQRASAGIQTLIDLNLPLRRDRYGRLQSIPAAGEAHAAEYRSLIHIELSGQYKGDDLVALEADLRNALGMLHKVVAGFPRMLTLCREAAQKMIESLPADSEESVLRMEAHAFLQWLMRGHFTFLAVVCELPGKPAEPCGLAAWPGHDPDLLQSETLPESGWQTVFAKSLTRSPIHHDRHADLVLIRTPDGGTYRFLGLYTSRVQQHDPMTMPVLRHKLSSLDLVSGLRKLSHEGRNFDRLLRTHPRDELLLANDQDLLNAFLPMVKQKYGNELRFIWRKDPWQRFVSVFIYLPKPIFSETFVSRTAEFLQARFNATDVEVTPFASEHRWIRLHMLLVFAHLSPPPINTEETEAVLKRLARTWDDELLTLLIGKYPPVLANQLFRRYQSVFPDNYKNYFRPQDAATDIGWLETQRPDTPLAVEMIPLEGRAARFKLLQWHQQLPLSRVMPMLESFGVKVLSEQAYALLLQDSCLWLHDFRTEMPESLPRELIPQSLSFVREAMQVLWRGEVEADSFNRLVTLVPCKWREANLFRALSAWLKQGGFPLSAQAQVEALCRYPQVARQLLELFHARFDPALNGERASRTLSVVTRLQAALEPVVSVADDRVLRVYLSIIQAIQRTSYYQPEAVRRNRLSFKLASRSVAELPEPRPWREIYVHAPETCGVHLRFGPVSRGGLRWSERPEDFRTEVLGLVKTQQVKNAVIVPAGAKGGFVVRDHCPGATLRERGETAYQVFVRGLLDLTDNRVDDRVVPPPQVVVHDPDDAYLVVAADKGTAGFSDIANGLAQEYGFWLGNAFASGGSHGFNHKTMGITARGAFVALRRLARECGFDPVADPFTLAGIGSMNGDVFGNGLLLSRSVRLVAAFSHQYLFFDPQPDPDLSYDERYRLFTAERSDWGAYNRSLISTGGGVFSRQEKSIPLSPEMQQMLDLTAPTATPDELVRAVLGMRVDVLWNGGIGTYVKSSEESHDQAADRANDNVRIDASRLRARIVCEGGNLGMTQRARIEYTLNGGRCHTDAIDNSGGVDCSDHEVNLKIFLHREIRAKRLTAEDADLMLREWQDEVAGSVLANNREQTLCLAIAVAEAGKRHREYGRLADFLEAHAGLDRKREYIPDPRAWQARELQGQPLTRPELSVLLAYSRNWLKSALAVPELMTDPLLVAELDGAFPESCRERFGDALRTHPLAPALAATRLAGALSTRLGLGMLPRLLDRAGVTPVRLARAFVVMRQVLGLEPLWRELESLEGAVAPEVLSGQFAMLQKTARRACDWLLKTGDDQPASRQIARYALLEELLAAIPDYLSAQRRADWRQGADLLAAQGLPRPAAERLAALDQIVHMLDICRLAHQEETAVAVAAQVYGALEEALGLPVVLKALQELPVVSAWEAEARDGLRSGLQAVMARLSRHVLAYGRAQAGDAADWLPQWMQSRSHALAGWMAFRGRLRREDLTGQAPFVVIASRLEAVAAELMAV